MKKNISFAYAIGSDELAEQAKYLTNSIRAFASSSNIYTFTTENEWYELSPSSREYFSRHSHILVGELPIEGYPVSAKLAAMRHASDLTSDEYVLLLDTDTVILDRINCHKDSSSELFLTPADKNGHYWATSKASDDWEQVYSVLDREFPGYNHETTISKTPIPPYWNAGFVMTSNHGFPERWISETKTVYNSNLPERFYSDQIALGCISTEYDVDEVGIRYNYPLPHRFRCPEDILVLHYHSLQPCGRILNRSIREKLNRIGIYHSTHFPTRIRRLRLLSGALLQLSVIKLRNTVREISRRF